MELSLELTAAALDTKLVASLGGAGFLGGSAVPARRSSSEGATGVFCRPEARGARASESAPYPPDADDADRCDDRDAETAALTTQAALTGHLVFSTLHTNEACGAVTRLMNLQIEPYLVAATLRGVLKIVCRHVRMALQPKWCRTLANGMYLVPLDGHLAEHQN